MPRKDVTVEDLGLVIQRDLLELLAAQNKIPFYCPLEGPLLMQAVTEAAKNCVGVAESVNKLKIEFGEPLTPEDRRLGRSRSILVSGPHEVMERLIAIFTESPRKASDFIDVDVKFVKEQNAEATPNQET